MPSDLAMKTMNGAHRILLGLTGGRFGWHVNGMPVLELTTTGRRSGEPRTVLLTSPIRHDGAHVVVASRGGDDRHPAWFLNIEANPSVTVTFQGGEPQPMTARVATPAERDVLWPKITGRFRNYAGYQAKTSRVIPLVLLTPSGS